MSTPQRILTSALAVVALFLGGQSAHAQVVAPTISGIGAASNSAGTDVTVTWTTNQPASSQIFYGLTSSYTASTTLNSTASTSHSVGLTGLTPNTTYHFMLFSANASGTAATSSDLTFTTPNPATTTPATTTAPMISGISATSTTNGTGATIVWTTDQPATSQVFFGLTSTYTGSTTITSSLATSHSVDLTGLAPNTTYHFMISTTNAGDMNATSTDMTFTTGSAMSTTTPPTTDLTTLQNLVNQLLARVAALEQQIQTLLNNQNNGNQNGGGNNGGNTGSNGGATGTISTNHQTVRIGESVDFSGRGFGHEEGVNVMLGGNVIGSAHADGGGNFSTGSMSVPTTAGTYTYTFKGVSSGITATITITVAS